MNRTNSWHQELFPAIINKLKELEDQAVDPSFWLTHQKFLNVGGVTREEVLDFIMEGRHSPVPANSYACEQCNTPIVVLDAEKDEWLCIECGMVQDRERRYFKPFTPESSIYKHNVRLHQILHELQCNRMKLPGNIVEDVRDHVKTNFTYTRIQKSLRKLGYKQHYTMIPTIQQALDPNFIPLQLTRLEEEELTGLFNQYIALGQFAGYRNRLNYHYVISKLAEMLGYDWIQPHLRLPKGKKSIQRHDDLWEKICLRLNWTTLSNLRPQIPDLQHKGRLSPLSCSPTPLGSAPDCQHCTLQTSESCQAVSSHPHSPRVCRNPCRRDKGRRFRLVHPYVPKSSKKDK